MNTHPLLAGLQQSPDYFLQNLDFANRRGLIVRVNEATYRHAAFLDERMFTPATEGAWFPLDSILDAAAQLPAAQPTQYIFHVGHCGSTLVSRLLGQLPGTISLREPLTLLALAMERREPDASAWRLGAAERERLSAAVLKLLARRYRTTDTVIVKCTSVASNLLEEVLTRNAAAHALFLHVGLETYLASMLRAAANRESVRAYAPAWLADLRRVPQFGVALPSNLDDGQKTVLAWTMAMLHAERAARAFPARVRFADFDQLLAALPRNLAAIAGFLELSAPADGFSALLADPLLHRYAKDPKQMFDTATRARELQEARNNFHDEIHAGLEWAAKLWRETPAFTPLAGNLD